MGIGTPAARLEVNSGQVVARMTRETIAPELTGPATPACVVLGSAGDIPLWLGVSLVRHGILEPRRL